jgi:hypothetical protein
MRHHRRQSRLVKENGAVGAAPVNKGTLMSLYTAAQAGCQAEIARAEGFSSAGGKIIRPTNLVRMQDVDRASIRASLLADGRGVFGVGLAGLSIVPLATAAEIDAEGRAMHHCARTYIDKVAVGDCCLYSARRGDKRVATIEGGRTGDGRVAITQMRGPCNAVLDAKLSAVLRRWAGQQAKWRPKSEVTPAERAPVAAPWRAARVAAPWRRPAPAAEAEAA